MLLIHPWLCHFVTNTFFSWNQSKKHLSIGYLWFVQKFDLGSKLIYSASCCSDRSANYASLVSAQLITVASHMVVLFFPFVLRFQFYIILTSNLHMYVHLYSWTCCFLILCHHEGWAGTSRYWYLVHDRNNSREKQYWIQAVCKLFCCHLVFHCDL